MGKEFSVRQYREGDENGILDLLESAFPNWGKLEKSHDYWRWKYLATPLGTFILVAESDGIIIGVSHNMLLNLKVGDSILLVQFSSDATTHKDYRGLGVMGAIIKEVERLRPGQNVKLGYGASHNQAIIKEWLKLGRVPFPHRISYMVRIRDVDLYLKLRPMENPEFIKTGYKALTGLNKIRRTLKGKVRRETGFDIRSVAHFNDDNDIFWKLVQKDYSFIPDRSSRFLNWRYCDPRGDRFIVKQAVADGVVLGYIVYRLVKDDEYPEGLIVDLLALPGRLDVVDGLLSDACEFFDGLGVNVVYYMVVKGHSYQGLSVDHGFIDSRRAPYITFQVVDAADKFEALRASPPGRVYLAYCDML